MTSGTAICKPRSWRCSALFGRLIAVAFCALTALTALPAQASSQRYCDAPGAISAAQQDRLFRFAAVIKAELEASGQAVALVARAGLDLGRFGQRYSHAGFSLKQNPQTPWAVRQLYYECDAQQSRLFDQGLLAFLLGAENQSVGFFSLVLLPPAAATAVEQLALDKARALQVLSPRYSANSFPFSLQFQNCNQWVAEMLATAWGSFDGADAPRQQAQTWLQAQGYEPTVFDVGWHVVMWLSGLSPWLHSADHPRDDIAAKRFRVSMPASLESFVQRQWPQSQRIEFCHTTTQIVVHHGWHNLATDCVPGDGDTVIALN
jgi:hypothetical protein